MCKIFILLCLSLTIASPKIVEAKKEVVVQNDFEKSIEAVQVKFKGEIDKINTVQQNNVLVQSKIQKETTILVLKQDSLYGALKISVKAIYDKEMEKVSSQEQELQGRKQKIETTYQAALKKIEALKIKPEIKENK